MAFSNSQHIAPIASVASEAKTVTNTDFFTNISSLFNSEKKDAPWCTFSA